MLKSVQFFPLILWYFMFGIKRHQLASTASDRKTIRYEFSFISNLLNFSTFSVGGCWGQPMYLFWKMVDETQIPKPLEATRNHNSIKLLIFLPLRADLLISVYSDTPCIKRVKKGKNNTKTLVQRNRYKRLSINYVVTKSPPPLSSVLLSRIYLVNDLWGYPPKYRVYGRPLIVSITC